MFTQTMSWLMVVKLTIGAGVLTDIPLLTHEADYISLHPGLLTPPQHRNKLQPVTNPPLMKLQDLCPPRFWERPGDVADSLGAVGFLKGILGP